jgi:hypothetical protein
MEQSLFGPEIDEEALKAKDRSQIDNFLYFAKETQSLLSSIE